MDPPVASPALALKGEGARDMGRAVSIDPSAADDRDGGRALACSVCRRPITSEAARIQVDGRHEHTFANPFGYAYTIGCFSAAVGLAGVGPTSSEFSWFAGRTWQIEQCAGCGEHLGWVFRGPGSAFHGLILDRLIEVEGQTE
jgi:hypothetical protein